MTVIPQIEPYFTSAEKQAVTEYLDSGGWLTEHRATRELEQLVQVMLSVDRAIAVPNGTIGLYLALCMALPQNRQCRVAVPAYTMIATVNAVLWAGHAPVLIDIDSSTGCMSLEDLQSKNDIDAVLYVAINGRTGNMFDLVDHCKNKNIVLLEDACQAFVSTYQYKACGTFGKVGVFSMSPHKIITTGQGGIIVTNDYMTYLEIKRLKDFGRVKSGVDLHSHFGLNFKFTDLQAIIGIQQLNIISYRITRKLKIFNDYVAALPKGMQILPLAEGNIPWFIDVLCENTEMRDSLVQYLTAQNIGTRNFYPVLTEQESLKGLATSDFPNATKFSATGVWLPSSIGLTDMQLDYIFLALNSFK